MRIITVKIDEYLYQELQLYSMNQNRSMSSIIREALMEYLENAEEAEEQ
jgi:metal-responsive CopG/Arc/MetJ family transcriptional regulator